MCPPAAMATGCPCLASIAGQNTSVVTVAGQSGNTSYTYPDRYGLSTCATHDAGLEPFCNDADPPSWCSRAWCYVDPDNCDGYATYKSTYYPFTDAFYSWETCGGSVVAIEYPRPVATLQLCSVMSRLDAAGSGQELGGADDAAGTAGVCGNNPYFTDQVAHMVTSINQLNNGSGFAVLGGRTAGPLYYHLNYSLLSYEFNEWDTSTSGSKTGLELSQTIFPTCDFIVGMPNGCPDREIRAQVRRIRVVRGWIGIACNCTRDATLSKSIRLHVF